MLRARARGVDPRGLDLEVEPTTDGCSYPLNGSTQARVHVTATSASAGGKVRLEASQGTFTGGMAASDSLIQQMLGHGITAKLSAKLGEGLLNGLLTARLGLAAIDVTRPLPFAALPRPMLSDLAKDLLKRAGGGDDPKS